MAALVLLLIVFVVLFRHNKEFNKLFKPRSAPAMPPPPPPYPDGPLDLEAIGHSIMAGAFNVEDAAPEHNVRFYIRSDLISIAVAKTGYIYNGSEGPTNAVYYLENKKYCISLSELSISFLIRMRDEYLRKCINDKLNVLDINNYKVRLETLYQQDTPGLNDN